MSRPITVMHVLFRFSIGGLENGLVNLINGLDNSRYRHVIVCLSDYDPAFVRRLQTRDIEIYALGKRPGQDPRVWWRMWRLLRRIRPAVLHTRNFATLELQLLACLTGVHGRLHGEHGWDVQDLDGSKRKYRIARRVLGLFVQRFIALSHDLERYLLRDVGLEAKKIVQIYNGVDTERFVAAHARSSAATVVIGTVGRMKAVKNQTLLCQAFVALLARRPDLVGKVSLKLIGDGPLRRDCTALVTSAQRQQWVEFTGDSCQVAEQMRGLDVFVLPSLAEGISNTILEAMASSLPVIATAVGGNVELVADGQSGCLVASGDVAAMSAAIERYVEDAALRSRHGAYGRQLVESHFSLPRMLARYDQIYQGLAA